jgi:hypothetical protein
MEAFLLLWISRNWNNFHNFIWDFICTLIFNEFQSELLGSRLRYEIIDEVFFSRVNWFESHTNPRFVLSYDCVHLYFHLSGMNPPLVFQMFTFITSINFLPHIVSFVYVLKNCKLNSQHTRRTQHVIHTQYNYILRFVLSALGHILRYLKMILKHVLSCKSKPTQTDLKLRCLNGDTILIEIFKFKSKNIKQ